MGALAVARRGFPAAYRAGSSAYRNGFQNSEANQARAANDNVSVPRAANDNATTLGSSGVPSIPASLGRSLARSASPFARLLGRSVPGLNIALLALDLYDLYQLWNQWGSQWGWAMNWNGWYMSCGLPNGTIIATGLGCGSSANFANADIGHIYSAEGPAGVWTQYCNFGEYKRPGPTGFQQYLVVGKAVRALTNKYVDDMSFPYYAYPSAPGGAVPPFIPAVQPGAIPILSPVPEPQPIPYESLPYRRPSGWPESSAWGNAAPGEPVGSPGQVPGPQIVLTPTGYTAQPSTPFRPPRPPKRGEKEKKGVVSLNASGNKLFIATGKAFGAITELADFIEAIYEAIPEAIRGKRKRSLVNQMKFIASHYESIVLDDAILNVIQNQVEDAAIGKLAQAATKSFAKATGRPVGVTWGKAL